MGLNINNALHNYFWALEEMSVGDGCDDSMEQLFLSENGYISGNFNKNFIWEGNKWLS
jgi:hypothetical protein